MATATDAFQIIATPQDRWHIANFLLKRNGLSFKGRQEQKILHRTKTALSLHGPAGPILGDAIGTVPHALDTTPNICTVTSETVEFLQRCLEKVGEKEGVPPMMAQELDFLEPVMEQLEDRALAAKTVAAHPDAKPVPDDEDWSLVTSPILKNPARLVDVLAELLRRHAPNPGTEPAFAAFVSAFLEEAELPPIPGKQRGGRLRLAAEQAPS